MVAAQRGNPPVHQRITHPASNLMTSPSCTRFPQADEQRQGRDEQRRGENYQQEFAQHQ